MSELHDHPQTKAVSAIPAATGQAVSNYSLAKPVERDFALDLLRVSGFALILLAHFSGYGLADYVRLPEIYTVSTGLGLLFFVSGYVLTLRHRRMSSAGEMLGFVGRRALRILPLYWLALATFLVMFVFAKVYHDVDFKPLLPRVLAHIAALQVVFEPITPALFTLWFIGNIVLYYLVFVLLARFAASATKVMLLAALVLGICGLARIGLGLFGNRFFIYFPVFILGILAGRVESGLQLSALALTVLACATFAAAAMLWPVRNAIYPDDVVRPRSSLWVDSLRVAFICLVSILSFAVARAVSDHSSARIGRIITVLAFSSYAAYLFHRPILIVLAVILKHGLGLSKASTTWALIAAGTPLIFVVSYFLQVADCRLQRKISPWLVSRRRVTQ